MMAKARSQDLAFFLFLRHFGIFHENILKNVLVSILLVQSLSINEQYPIIKCVKGVINIDFRPKSDG